MSNIDKITANQQLFTELTPEEGAVVEGGAKLLVRSLTPENPPPHAQNPMVLVGTTVAFEKGNVKTKQWIVKEYNFTNNTTLSIWDNDPGSHNEDLLASVTISQTPTGVKQLKAPGYTVNYQVI